MWIRKCDKDEKTGNHLPIPCQMISNEEIKPVPQTETDKRVEQIILDSAERYSKKLGIDRRTFLRTTGGMACAFLALNKVFGKFYDVDEVEIYEPAATEEKLPKGVFIFDNQTHFCQDGMKTNLRAMPFLKDIGAPIIGNSTEDYNFRTYIKEVFFDSDTTMALLSGIPSRADIDYWGKPGNKQNILPVDMAVSVRNQVNQMAGSQRMLVHGLIAPNHYRDFSKVAEEMEREAKVLKVDSWKHYTHIPLNDQPWRYDDEKVAYPFWEKSLQLGINITCVHKGLADTARTESFAHPRDIKKAALDFPQMNFVIYHSGMRHGYRGFNSGGGADAVKADSERLGGVQWTRDLCKDRDENPKMTNVYPEIGSVFAMCVGDPVMMAHLLGSLMKSFGADHIIWGTDCLWWGSPQWIIQAMHRFQMPEEMQKKWGYPPITKRDKEMIFGLNAARLYKIDVKAQRKAIPQDYMTRYKAAYIDSGRLRDNRYYGWVAD